nr:hypothetical protein PJ912_15485 [Pectobacterium colocasium]
MQKQVLKVFTALAQAGHGVLLITHDLAVVAEVADRVIVMQQGLLVEGGEARQLLSAPTHPYTRKLLAAIPTASTRGKWLAGTDPLQNGIAPSPASLAADHASTDDAIVLSADRIAVSFKRPDGSRMQAVNQVSLQIKRGETLGIVGESGFQAKPRWAKSFWHCKSRTAAKSDSWTMPGAH